MLFNTCICLLEVFWIVVVFGLFGVVCLEGLLGFFSDLWRVAVIQLVV